MHLVKVVSQAIEPNYLYAHCRFSGVAEMIAVLANITYILRHMSEGIARVELLIQSWGSSAYSWGLRPIYVWHY